MRLPALEVLDELAVEIEGLSAGLANKGPLGLAALGSHWVGECDPDATVGGGLATQKVASARMLFGQEEHRVGEQDNLAPCADEDPTNDCTSARWAYAAITSAVVVAPGESVPSDAGHRSCSSSLSAAVTAHR